MKRTLARTGVLVATGALVAVFSALPASAHVVADPDTAPQGGFTKIAFRVPNESETAGTVKLEVTLPADHPITSARTMPVPGRTTQITKAPLDPPVQDEGRTITEAPRTITWTSASGTRINPGEFIDFDVSMGPLPTNVDQLVMPATQTYDDGTVVAWDAPPDPPASPSPNTRRRYSPSPLPRPVARLE
jgi:uncharacterized protein YcnI